MMTNKYPQKMAEIVISLILFLSMITLSIGQESISSDTAILSFSTITTNMNDNINGNELKLGGFFCENMSEDKLITKSSYLYSGSENKSSCHEYIHQSQSCNVKMTSHFDSLYVTPSETDDNGQKLNPHYEDFEGYDVYEYDEDYEDYEFDIDYEDDIDDGAYAGGVRKQRRIPPEPEEYPIPPPELVYATSMAYDESFLRKLGSKAACVEYINEVVIHAQGRLKDETLRSKLHLDVKQKPRFLPNISLNVDHEDLDKTAYHIPANESLVIFTEDGDDDEAMGVTKPRAGCDPIENKIIVKWRSSHQKAGIALAHEYGHLALGLNHDDVEDSKIENKIVPWNVSGKCDTGNKMMNKSPSMDGTLPTWSECNHPRFDKFYAKIGHKCLEKASPPKIELPDVVGQTVQTGETISLKCKTYGAPKPDLQWYHGNHKLHSGERRTVYEGGSLEIRDMHLEDAGEYACKATNSLNYTTIRMTIIIQEVKTLSPASLEICVIIAYLAICYLVLYVLYLESKFQDHYEYNVLIPTSPIDILNDEEETTETSRASTPIETSRAAIFVEVNTAVTPCVTSCADTPMEVSKAAITQEESKPLIERGLRYSQGAMLPQQGKIHTKLKLQGPGRRRVRSLSCSYELFAAHS